MTNPVYTKRNLLVVNDENDTAAVITSQSSRQHKRQDSSSSFSSEVSSIITTAKSRKRPRCNSFPSKIHCVVISPEATPISVPEEDGGKVVVTPINTPRTLSIPIRTHPGRRRRRRGGGPASVGLVFEAAPRHAHERLHKERPNRIACIRRSLQDSGWLDRCTVLGCQERPLSMSLVKESINKVHSVGYLSRLDKLDRCSCLKDEEAQYDSIYLTKYTWEDAQNAVTALLSLVDQVLTENLSSGFACIRPPGHHAEPGLAGGFCIVNNVAVAAEYALSLGKERIVILDWDVHHGNGTQTIFWNNPQVLYISIHVQKTFPFSSNKTCQSIGGNQAKGKTVNVAWSSEGMGNEEYLGAMQHLILPIIKEFQPSLTLISAGFDAAVGDVGNCNVTPTGFGQMTHQLLETLQEINCPVVATLEGGYRQSILGECVTQVVEAMANNEASKYNITETAPDIPTIDLEDICSIAKRDIEKTRQALQTYWKCCDAPQPTGTNNSC